MAIQTITYDDKVALNENPSVAEINKVTDNNMNEIKNTINTNTPVGSISLFAGTTAPNGWLICDGSAVSRTTYANLFSVIGTTYGSGNGSTTFNIPNLKGKVPVGLDSSDTSFDTIGETMIFEGSSVILGAGVCRHLNTFLFELLAILGYNVRPYSNIQKNPTSNRYLPDIIEKRYLFLIIIIILLFCIITVRIFQLQVSAYC